MRSLLPTEEVGLVPAEEEGLAPTEEEGLVAKRFFLPLLPREPQRRKRVLLPSSFHTWRL